MYFRKFCATTTRISFAKLRFFYESKKYFEEKYTFSPLFIKKFNC
jgi:hypothetical protein